MINKMSITQVLEASRKMRIDFPDCIPQILVRRTGRNDASIILVPVKVCEDLPDEHMVSVTWEKAHVISQTRHASMPNEKSLIRKRVSQCRALLRDDEINA